MRQSRVMFSLCLCFLLYPAIRLCSAATLTCGTSDVACLIASITAANRTPEADTIRLAAGTYVVVTSFFSMAHGDLASCASHRILRFSSLLCAGEPTMRLVHVLPQWLSGTGPRLPVTDLVPASHPIRQWAETFPWAAWVSAIEHSLHKRFPTTFHWGRRPVPLRVL